MILARSQVGRSIAVILRRATNLSAVRTVRSRPITAEEAEMWSLRRAERRAKLRAEANAVPWPVPE